MLSFLLRGGVVMAPLALLSVVAVAVIVERCLVLAHRRADPRDLAAHVVRRLGDGARGQLIEELSGATSPEARVLSAGIGPALLPSAERESMMQAEASRIMAEMEQRVSWLSSIANVAMLLGLLGTVTGMIGAFASVRAAGYSNPTVLSGGISEALISTAAGLVVAIPSLVAYHLFAHAIGRAATRMELAAADLLAYLAQAAPAAVRDRPAQRTSAQTQRGEKGPAQRRVVRKEGRTRRAP